MPSPAASSQPPKLLLFLDIDGVLNQAGKLSTEPAFEESCLSVLRSLTSEFQTRIVMTTSWRAGIPAQGFAQRLLAHKILSPVIGLTPYLSSKWSDPVSPSRGDEIAAWLSQNPQTPDTALLILEDHQDITPLNDFAYFTNPASGLTPSDLPPIRRLINQQLNTPSHV